MLSNRQCQDIKSQQPRVNARPAQHIDQNNRLHFNMSKTIHINSASHFQELIQSSTIVVTDCESACPPPCPTITATCFNTCEDISVASTDLIAETPIRSLRRLVRPMQADCPRLRTALRAALAPEQDRLRQGRRGQAARGGQEIWHHGVSLAPPPLLPSVFRPAEAKH